MIEKLKIRKQKQGVTRKKEEKGKIKGKTENRERKKKKKKEKKKKGKNRESQFRRHAPIGYFPLSLSKSCPLPKAKKGVPLGTNHSGSLLSK